MASIELGTNTLTEPQIPDSYKMPSHKTTAHSVLFPIKNRSLRGFNR